MQRKPRRKNRYSELVEYKESRRQIALQLGYGYDIANKISEAESEIEVDQILRSARLNN